LEYCWTSIIRLIRHGIDVDSFDKAWVFTFEVIVRRWRGIGFAGRKKKVEPSFRSTEPARNDQGRKLAAHESERLTHSEKIDVEVTKTQTPPNPQPPTHSSLFEHPQLNTPNNFLRAGAGGGEALGGGVGGGGGLGGGVGREELGRPGIDLIVHVGRLWEHRSEPALCWRSK